MSLNSNPLEHKIFTSFIDTKLNEDSIVNQVPLFLEDKKKELERLQIIWDKSSSLYSSSFYINVPNPLKKRVLKVIENSKNEVSTVDTAIGEFLKINAERDILADKTMKLIDLSIATRKMSNILENFIHINR